MKIPRNYCPMQHENFFCKLLGVIDFLYKNIQWKTYCTKLNYIFYKEALLHSLCNAKWISLKNWNQIWFAKTADIYTPNIISAVSACFDMSILPRDRIQVAGTQVANSILFGEEQITARLFCASAKTWEFTWSAAQRVLTLNPWTDQFISTHRVRVCDTFFQKYWIPSSTSKTENQLSSWFWGLGELLCIL